MGAASAVVRDSTGRRAIPPLDLCTFLVTYSKAHSLQADAYTVRCCMQFLVHTRRTIRSQLNGMTWLTSQLRIHPPRIYAVFQHVQALQLYSLKC
jgi:hypothetical protein